jgi:hypothetical protein
VATGVTADFCGFPPEAIKAALDKVSAFVANPYLGNRRGKKNTRKVDDRELLIADKGAR